MASRRSGRSASTAQPVALDIPASQESAEGNTSPLPSKVKTLTELTAQCGVEKENLVNHAIPVAKRVGRARKPKVLQAEVLVTAPISAPASATGAATSSTEGVKAAKKTSKKKVVLPEEDGKDAVEEEAKGVTKEEVDAVIEDLQSFEISHSSRPTRKTAVRVNYKVLNETGERQRMPTTKKTSDQ